jgi:cation diffusion facilitator family transporter
MTTTKNAIQSGVRSTLLGAFINILLAVIKGFAGVLGNSFALVADAIESLCDIFSSLVVLVGLKMAGRPADTNHPYGHGKYEPLAGVIVAMVLFGAAIFIAIESVRGIITPHHAPAAFTLWVLLVVIVIKESLFRFVKGIGDQIHSSAVKADAWHHRSDAITSMAAFVGISIALLCGPGYESADDFAALIAACIILINAMILLKPALFELLDTAPDPQLHMRIRDIAVNVPGVYGTHKCHVRKLGFDYFVDLDVLCDPDATIRQGHTIAHDVGEAIHAALPEITKVLVHVEPKDDFGRRDRG